MKYIKMLGLLAVAIAALMAFASSVSATITSPPGTAYTGEIRMTSTHVAFHTGGEVECGHSEIIGSVTNGGTTIPITSINFSQCGTSTISIVKKGHISIASSGAITVSGTEYTKTIHKTIFGFPLTTHCVLMMENTKVGTFTEGVDPAVWHTESVPIPSSVETDSACTESAQITGTYTVTKPTGAITVD